MIPRPFIAGVLALALVAGACADDEESGKGSDGTTTTANGSAGRGQPSSEGDGSSEEGGEPAPPGPEGSTPAPGPGGEDQSEGEPGGGGEANEGSEQPALNDRGALGTLGRALLSSSTPEVVIEIDATEGEGLTTQARNALRDRLLEHGQKGSVGFAGSSVVPAQDVYTTDDLRALMEAHRSVYSTSTRAAVYILVLSGRHEKETVLGETFNASSFAVFPEQVSGGLLGLNYANFEEAVVVHELGHLFGLVNLTGKGAFHEDPQHKKHSANDESVMYWAVESSTVEEIFEGGPPRTFDADDETEMAAIRAS